MVYEPKNGLQGLINRNSTAEDNQAGAWTVTCIAWLRWRGENAGDPGPVRNVVNDGFRQNSCGRV